jgi:Tfp pilus assembly protein PilN
MFRRPAVTLLLVTNQSIVRADFSGGAKPKLLESWDSPRPDLDDLPSFVEAALMLGGKPGRKVWVLATDFWTQTLAMQARAAAKLTGEDLSRALGFEVETLSGITAFESIIGQANVPARKADELAYWVVQARTTDRQAIEQIVRLAGSRLAGLCHPGGLPRSLTPEDDPKSSWQRVELWPDVIVCMHGEPGQSPNVHLINADSRQERWHAEEEDWRRQHGRAARREMFLTTGEFVLFGEDGEPRPAEPKQSRDHWLTGWAEELARRTAAVPLIRPAPRPLSNGAWFGIAACIGLVTLGLCVAHSFTVRSWQLAPLRKEIEKLRGPAARLDALEKDITQRDKDIAELRKQYDSLQLVNETMRAQRQRLARLLAALGDHRPDDLQVQKIEGDPGQPVLHGVCLNQNEANNLAARLAKELAPEWEIRETKMKAQHNDRGTTYAFQVTLQIPRPAAPVTTPVKGGRGGKP